MAGECCGSFGGRVTIKAGDYNLAPTEAEITIMPTNTEVEAQANQDGSVARIVRPQPFMAEIAFRKPCGAEWMNIFKACALNVTIVEEDTGRQHLYTGAFVTGRPSVNLSTGEVTGVTIASPTYRELTAA